ncbi:amino acid ABC transporter permease [Candidatus Bipolaricaulota bacterium]
MTLRISTLLDRAPYIFGGAYYTTLVTVYAFVIALVLGLLLALVKMAKNPLARGLATVYVEFFRNLPALVLLFWIFYALPVFGLKLSAITSVSLALGLNVSGYMAEAFRTGLQSVNKDEIDAGLSLGMGRVKLLQKIIVPQAARVSLPLIITLFASLLRWSSLVAAVGVSDLAYRARIVSSTHYIPVEVYTGIALFYLVVSSLVSFGSSRIEKRWAKRYAIS